MKFYKIFLTLISLLAILSFSGCGSNSNTDTISKTGTLSLGLTDSVIDASNVSGVYITITGIKYHIADSGWKSMSEFNESKTINLLDLQDGNVTALGDFTLPAGKYTQIRLDLNTSIEGNTSGCYMTYNDGSDNQPLSVPSGEEKLTGSFDVPVNGDVNVTIDFDVAKSIVKQGNGKYKLKPTLRLVVNNQAGSIQGTLINADSNTTYRVYAYQDWDTATPDVPDFNDSISSTNVKDNNFTLSFLSPGTYDLVVVTLDDTGSYNGDYQVFDNNATVKSQKITKVTLGL